MDAQREPGLMLRRRRRRRREAAANPGRVCIWTSSQLTPNPRLDPNLRLPHQRKVEAPSLARTALRGTSGEAWELQAARSRAAGGDARQNHFQAAPVGELCATMACPPLSFPPALSSKGHRALEQAGR